MILGIQLEAASSYGIEDFKMVGDGDHLVQAPSPDMSW